jgi:hypothetical protein
MDGLAPQVFSDPFARTVPDGTVGSMNNLPAWLSNNIGLGLIQQFDHGPVALDDMEVGVQDTQRFAHGVEGVPPHFVCGLERSVGSLAGIIGRRAGAKPGVLDMQ